MNTELKIGIIAALLLGGAGLIMIANAGESYVSISQPINYLEYVDNDTYNVTFQTAYLPITGGNTRTFTVLQVVANINISQPQTIKSSIKAAINAEAIARGFNLKKMIIPAYDVVNP